MTIRERHLLHLGSQAMAQAVRYRETHHVVATDLDDPTSPDLAGAGLYVAKHDDVRPHHRILATVRWQDRPVLDYLAD